MSVCLSHTLGLSREQRGLGRLKLAQSSPPHVTRTPLSRSEGQRSSCRGRGHIVVASRTTCSDCNATDCLAPIYQCQTLQTCIRMIHGSAAHAATQSWSVTLNNSRRSCFNTNCYDHGDYVVYHVQSWNAIFFHSVL